MFIARTLSNVQEHLRPCTPSQQYKVVLLLKDYTIRPQKVIPNLRSPLMEHPNTLHVQLTMQPQHELYTRKVLQVY